MKKAVLAADRPRFLMCEPSYYGVEYVINPWMRGNRGRVSVDAAARQWRDLTQLLTAQSEADLALVAPVPHQPDMVFTANAGLVRGDVCVPAAFRHPERRGEEPAYRAWFGSDGKRLAPVPGDAAFEGAGDALFDTRPDPVLWAAYGFRTDAESHEHLARTFGCETVSLRLVNPRFYHLDTCFCPLPGGLLMWHSRAFDSESQAKVAGRFAPDMRLDVSEQAAEAFVCNAVVRRSDVIANTLTDAEAAPVREWLAARGLTVRLTPLDEFMKAGGSAKCLTLRMN